MVSSNTLISLKPPLRPDKPAIGYIESIIKL